eukprot:TRINITY_DN1928_c0_g1_i3.p1 TRINITY_DN1928_c0_g1~~TRINITY_DN1928_c0_g1_i3.p1  ORF type:complete len:139 (-),score=32.99 TRINITY_DN1928_c0_g1_i3:130-546(-)
MYPLANPPDKREHAYLHKTMLDLQTKFIDHVESSRGAGIKVPVEERRDKLYQANVVSGERAAELGLIDEVGTYRSVLGKKFPNVRFVECTYESRLEKWRRVYGGAQTMLYEDMEPEARLTDLPQQFVQELSGAKERLS